MTSQDIIARWAHKRLADEYERLRKVYEPDPPPMTRPPEVDEIAQVEFNTEEGYSYSEYTYDTGYTEAIVTLRSGSTRNIHLGAEYDSTTIPTLINEILAVAQEET